MDNGKHTWAIKITKTSHNLVMIGVSSNTNYCQKGCWAGWTRSDSTNTHTYAYFSATGKRFDNIRESPYSQSYTTGDTIGVLLDMTKKSILFSKNGKDMGVAFINIKSGNGIKYRLMIGLKSEGDAVERISYTSIPVHGQGLNQEDEKKNDAIQAEGEEGNVEVDTHDFVSASMEAIIKQNWYIKAEYSDSVLNAFDVKKLKAATKYFDNLQEVVDKLQVELDKYKREIGQRQETIRSCMKNKEVDIGNYKNWTYGWCMTKTSIKLHRSSEKFG